MCSALPAVGHLVFLPANSIVNGDLWSLFDRPFSLGFPVVGSGAHFPEGVLLVHQERIWQADLNMRALSAGMQEDESETFKSAVQRRLLHCPQSKNATQPSSQCSSPFITAC
jgi:hypothetical protein